jgi:hypothetical protein
MLFYNIILSIKYKIIFYLRTYCPPSLSIPTSWPLPIHHGINPHQSESNPRPPHSQGSALIPILPTKCQATSPQARMSMRVFKMSIYHINSL